MTAELSLEGIFLPGLGARAAAYAASLPEGVLVRQPPSPRDVRGSFAGLVDWLLDDVIGDRRVRILGGHSMGAALAVLAAARRPGVERLVLLSPAGLPLTKPVGRIARDTARNLARGVPRPRHAALSAAELIRSPADTRRLVAEVRRLDLATAMARLREDGIEIDVVGCADDTLVPVEVARRIAARTGGRYREVRSPHGHAWPLGEPELVRSLFR